MQRRYEIGHRHTAWGSTVYLVIDAHSGEQVLDFLTLGEAYRRADTLNQAYEIFVEATAAWRRRAAA